MTSEANYRYHVATFGRGIDMRRKYSPDVQRYRDQLLRLAMTHEIHVHENPDPYANPDFAAAQPRRLLDNGRLSEAHAYLPHIVNDTSYATALHEFGHIIADGGDPPIPPDACSCGRCPGKRQKLTLMEHYDRLHAEVIAWDWARANALEWTVGMDQVRKFALQSYTDGVEEARKAEGL